LSYNSDAVGDKDERLDFKVKRSNVKVVTRSNMVTVKISTAMRSNVTVYVRLSYRCDGIPLR